MDNNRRIIGYDPNTGFPIYEERKIIGYDPNTGVPIYENNNNNVTYNNIKVKMSAATIVTLILMILSFTLIYVFSFMIEQRCVAEGLYESDRQGYGWLLILFLWPLAIFYQIYYIVLFIMNKTKDKQNAIMKKNGNTFGRWFAIIFPYVFILIHELLILMK